jgi:hypothetical protein
VQEGVHPVVDRGDPVEMSLGDLDRARLAARDRRAELGGRHSGEVHQASSSRFAGTRKRPSSAAGGGREHLVPRQARHVDVGPEHVGQRNRVRRRRDVGGGDLLHPGHRAEDHVELAGEHVQLLVGDGETGQPGEVREPRPG